MCLDGRRGVLSGLGSCAGLGTWHVCTEQVKKGGGGEQLEKKRAACGGICRLSVGQNDSLKVDLLH